jgi:hypothetical protein
MWYWFLDTQTSILYHKNDEGNWRKCKPLGPLSSRTSRCLTRQFYDISKTTQAEAPTNILPVTIEEDRLTALSTAKVGPQRISVPIEREKQRIILLCVTLLINPTGPSQHRVSVKRFGKSHPLYYGTVET